MRGRLAEIEFAISPDVGIKPNIGYHDQCRLYMEGTHKVVLESAYEVAVYLQMSAGLPAPFSKKIGRNNSELVLHFATQVDAENFALAMQINIAGKSANGE